MTTAKTRHNNPHNERSDGSVILSLQEHDLGITIDELITDIVYEADFDKRKEMLEEYRRLDRLRYLYRDALLEGWGYFDWKKAEKHGWLCRKDYEDFQDMHQLPTPEFDGVNA